MQVEVFKTDICHADQQDCKTCVVAKAINRHLPALPLPTSNA